MDLEPNLSQMLHLVLVHSKLTIYIYRQLKRHVAFSVVKSTPSMNASTAPSNSLCHASSVRCSGLGGIQLMGGLFRLDASLHPCFLTMVGSTQFMAMKGTATQALT